jgi:hypothetical protein
MKGAYKTIFPLILLVTFSTGSAQSGDSTFTRWWSQFQAVVAHDENETIAGMIKFPLEWENLQMRSIQTKEEFLKRFPEIFTPDIKMRIAHLKPRKIPSLALRYCEKLGLRFQGRPFHVRNLQHERVYVHINSVMITLNMRNDCNALWHSEQERSSSKRNKMGCWRAARCGYPYDRDPGRPHWFPLLPNTDFADPENGTTPDLRTR